MRVRESSNSKTRPYELKSKYLFSTKKTAFKKLNYYVQKKNYNYLYFSPMEKNIQQFVRIR